jgi:hypothetical protein
MAKHVALCVALSTTEVGFIVITWQAKSQCG